MQRYPDISLDLEFRSEEAIVPEVEGAPHVEVIADAAGFTALRPEWGELLQASDADCLFLTWDWLHTWWKHLAAGRKLHLLAVRRGNQLLAIAPFAVRPRQPGRLLPFPALEFLGTGAVGSDYLDLIIRRGAEEEALQSIAGHLAENGSVVELRQVRAGSRLASRLASRLQKSGWAARQTITDVCPYLDIAGDRKSTRLNSSHH